MVFCYFERSAVLLPLLSSAVMPLGHHSWTVPIHWMDAAGSVRKYDLLKHVLIEHIFVDFDVEEDQIPSRCT